MSTTAEEAAASVPAATATAAEADGGAAPAASTTATDGGNESKIVATPVATDSGTGDAAEITESGNAKTDNAAVESKPKAGMNDTATATTSNTATTNNNDTRNLAPKFDQTSQKVVIHNVLKYIRAKELDKLTVQWLKDRPDLQIIKTKKPPKDSWIKVTMANESMVNPFIELINTGGIGGEAMVNGRGKPLFAKRADEMFAMDSRKRKVGDSNGDDINKTMTKRARQERPITILSNDEVRDKITPLWRMTYQEQLDTKAKEMVNKCAKKIVKEIKGKFRILAQEAKRGQRKNAIPPYDWVEGKRCIEMEQPVPSPKIYEYRNKCEFTVGYRLEAVEEEVKVEEAAVEGKEGGGAASGEEAKVTTEEVKEEAMEEDAKVVEKEDVKGASGETKEAAAKKEESDDVDMKVADGAKAKDNAKEATTEAAKEADPAPTPPQNFKKIPAAGFLAQGWSGGVYHPHCLQNMPDWSCAIADIFNNDFLPSSPAPPYDSKLHRGIWRTITLRLSLRTRECMVIVLHAPAKGGAGAREDGSDDYSKVFEGEKQRLVEMLTKDAIPKSSAREYPENHVAEEKGDEESSEGIRVTSIFFQEYEGLSNPKPDHPVQHVFGKKSLDERLGESTFQISPGAFFQTNTLGAEVLYSIVVKRIKEVTENPKDTLLLDVCCGTGTIGLTCLKEGVVGGLVGVDVAEPAIADAKINAEKNGYTDKATTKFIAAPAEKVLPDTMKNIPRDSPIVAVVDPARDGLHGVVIRTLRANEKIQRLVYVSCNPTGTLVRDAAMLCNPPTKKYPGRPFKPTLSQPVDMFPLTKHCEMVMTFDRMSEEEYEKYHGKE